MTLIGLGVFLVQLVLATEPFDATRGIDQLLFAREKRVTVGTDFDRNLLSGRTSLIFGTAGAGYLDIVVFWMNSRFHF